MDHDERKPRTYIIRRSQSLGYGFIAGHEYPTMVKQVQEKGPSFNCLRPGDIILRVNGINVHDKPREEITRMIQLSTDEIEITVREGTHDDYIRTNHFQDSKYNTLNRSSKSLVMHHNYPQSTLPPSNSSHLNRLVTSIAHQQNHPANHSSFTLNNDKPSAPTLSYSNTILKPKLSNGTEQEITNNNTSYPTVSNQVKYGRHSPLPQRCKSSIDATKNGVSSKNLGDDDNDQPLLKRSNTMRPMKPSTMRLFEVLIKIFSEVGRTTVLHYNQNTTVKTLLEELASKPIGISTDSQQIKSHFGLALTLDVESDKEFKECHMKRKPLHILDENDSIMKIGKLPYAKDLRLLYRMIHPPKDVTALYMQDKLAFEYLYQQSCNDLKLERFFPELDEDTTIKLSALHLLEYVHTNHSKLHGNSKDAKAILKLVKKTPGIEHFLPQSWNQSILHKRGKRNLSSCKKMETRLLDQLRKNFEEFEFEPPKVKSTTNLNRYSTTSFHELSLPEIKTSSSEYIKLQFLTYLSQLSCYGNFKRPIRKSASPIERTSAGECSSSLESVPRTSDSSPLIRQDSYTSSLNNNRVEYTNNNSLAKIAHINSRRSLNSAAPSINGHSIDQTDLAQTSSIESVSSITVNIQNSPSPQQTVSYLSQQCESYNPSSVETTFKMEPSPMPRQQVVSKPKEHNSIEKLYNQRYLVKSTPIDDMLQHIMPPPPPPVTIDDFTYQVAGQMFDSRLTSHFTRVLTDRDIERLRVPPPPKLFN